MTIYIRLSIGLPCNFLFLKEVFSTAVPCFFRGQGGQQDRRDSTPFGRNHTLVVVLIGRTISRIDGRNAQFRIVPCQQSCPSNQSAFAQSITGIGKSLGGVRSCLYGLNKVVHDRLELFKLQIGRGKRLLAPQSYRRRPHKFVCRDKHWPQW